MHGRPSHEACVTSFLVRSKRDSSNTAVLTLLALELAVESEVKRWPDRYECNDFLTCHTFYTGSPILEFEV